MTGIEQHLMDTVAALLSELRALQVDMGNAYIRIDRLEKKVRSMDKEDCA